VKNKIIESLLLTIKKAEISATLKNKVNSFLNQNDEKMENKNKFNK
jgi:hypothetical protein